MTFAAAFVVVVVAAFLFATAVCALVLGGEAHADTKELRDEVDRLRGEVAAIATSAPVEPSEVAPKVSGATPLLTERAGPLTVPVDTLPIAAALDRGLADLQPTTTGGRHRAA